MRRISCLFEYLMHGIPACYLVLFIPALKDFKSKTLLVFSLKSSRAIEDAYVTISSHDEPRSPTPIEKFPHWLSCCHWCLLFQQAATPPPTEKTEEADAASPDDAADGDAQSNGPTEQQQTKDPNDQAMDVD